MGQRAAEAPVEVATIPCSTKWHTVGRQRCTFPRAWQHLASPYASSR